MRLGSQVIITSRFEETLEQLKDLATRNERFVPIIREGNFLVEDAKLAIEKAYLASYEQTIVVLAADVFSPVVQNKLLKVIEEPPEKTDFILMLPTKASLLPTVRSRLPITVLDERDESESLGLDLDRLDVRSVYDFVQEHKRIDSAGAKALLERIVRAAVHSGRYRLDERTLEMFHQSRMALDKGSPTSFVLIAVLLKLLAKKKKERS